jgi:hypothetical protein
MYIGLSTHDAIQNSNNHIIMMCPARLNELGGINCRTGEVRDDTPEKREMMSKVKERLSATSITLDESHCYLKSSPFPGCSNLPKLCHLFFKFHKMIAMTATYIGGPSSLVSTLDQYHFRPNPYVMITTSTRNDLDFDVCNTSNLCTAFACTTVKKMIENVGIPIVSNFLEYTSRIGGVLVNMFETKKYAQFALDTFLKENPSILPECAAFICGIYLYM